MSETGRRWSFLLAFEEVQDEKGARDCQQWTYRGHTLCLCQLSPRFEIGFIKKCPTKDVLIDHLNRPNVKLWLEINPRLLTERMALVFSVQTAGLQHV